MDTSAPASFRTTVELHGTTATGLVVPPAVVDALGSGRRPAVAASLPAGLTGADLREVVRRAVLTHGRELTTQRLRAVVAEGRWRAAPLTGTYL